MPYLGSIPLIGLLFKTRTGGSTKNNLMIFIRPKILRDPLQAAYETDSKYNYMRDQQEQYNKFELLPRCFPASRSRMLPPPPPPPADDPKERASASPEEKARAAKRAG